MKKEKIQLYKPHFYFYFMKTLFIPVLKQALDLNINKIKFPNKFVLAYSIQYKKTADNIKKKLGNKVINSMQILGCSKLKTKYPIIVLADGSFHALNLALQNNQVYKLQENKLKKTDKNLLNKYKQKIKAGISKFLYAEKIGVIVSLKPGQEQLNLAFSLKNKLKKKAYIFLTNNININEFENFPLSIYINTACPTLIYDTNKIVNYQEIKKYV